MINNGCPHHMAHNGLCVMCGVPVDHEKPNYPTVIKGAEYSRDHWRYTFAAHAMQGILASVTNVDSDWPPAGRCAVYCREYADALLRELEGKDE